MTAPLVNFEPTTFYDDNNPERPTQSTDPYINANYFNAREQLLKEIIDQLLSIPVNIGLVPSAAKYTSASHKPVSGEFARYNPTTDLNITMFPAFTNQKFGVANLSTHQLTLTCSETDKFDDGTTSLTIKSGERVVILCSSGEFCIESGLSVSSSGAGSTATFGTASFGNSPFGGSS